MEIHIEETTTIQQNLDYHKHNLQVFIESLVVNQILTLDELGDLWWTLHDKYACSSCDEHLKKHP